MTITLVFLLVLIHRPLQGKLVIRATPEELVYNFPAELMEDFFGTFPVEEKQLDSVDKLLEYRKYPFSELYLQSETPERAALFEPFASNPKYHKNIFSIKKIELVPQWRKLFLSSSEETIEYQGNVFETAWFSLEDNSIDWELVEFAIKKQLNKMPSIQWLVDLLKEGDKESARRLFELFNLEDMTTELLAVFGNSADVESREEVFEIFTNRIDEILDQNQDLYLVMLCEAMRNFDAFGNVNEKLDSHLKDSEFGYLEYAEILYSIHENRTDKAFWSTFARIALATERKHPGSLYLPWIIENIPENTLYSWEMANFIVEAHQLCKAPKDRLVAMIPVEACPKDFLSLEELRNRWILTAPFEIKDNIKSLDQEARLKFYGEIFRSGSPLPLNWRCHDNNGPEKPFSKQMKSLAKVIIEGSQFNSFSMLVVLLAWAYLLREGGRMDLSGLFTQDQEPADWETMVKNIAYDADIDLMLGLLEFLEISSEFTPTQLRQLVDSSYTEIQEPILTN